MDWSIILSIAVALLTVPGSYHYTQWAQRRNRNNARTREQWEALGRRLRRTPDLFSAVHLMESRKADKFWRSALSNFIFNLVFAAAYLAGDFGDWRAFAALGHISLAFFWWIAMSVGDTPKSLQYLENGFGSADALPDEEGEEMDAVETGSDDE